MNAQISITSSSFSYTQDFASYSGTNLSISGWSATFTGTPTYNGENTGSSNSGGVYSYGTSGSTERALGALRSGTPGNISFTVSFTNNTGFTISGFTISYDFEQWRYSNTSGFTVTQTGLGSTSLSDLDGYGVASGTNGTVTVTPTSLTLSALEILDGSTFSITFTTTDVSGADNGIAIDNFMLSSIVLPVEFLSFDVSKKDRSSYISFITASETNNDYFTIERSTDGRDFEAIGEIKGAGNSTEQISYTFIDENPLSGVNYYRIKQTDFDGKYSYSDVKAVNHASNISTWVTPKNTSGSITVETDLDNYELTVYSSMGQMVEKYSAYSGKQTIDISELPNGIYYFVVHSTTSQETIKVVKY